MTVAISKALEEGAKAVVCGSTGNTSASAAAYAARAGLTCAVLIPEGYIALGKLAQALIHGARVLQIRANFDVALDIVRQLGDSAPVTVVNSINPYRIEGQKTGAFEIVDVLGDAPDVHCIPVGNAGNITAYWKGYREYQDAGRVTKLPRMLGFQAAGAAPIVAGPPHRQSRDGRHRHPHRPAGLVVRRHGGRLRVGRRDRGRHRRRDPGRLPVSGPGGVGVLRAGVGRVGRRVCSKWACPPAPRWCACSPATASRIPTSPSARSPCRPPSTPTCGPCGPSSGSEPSSRGRQLPVVRRRGASTGPPGVRRVIVAASGPPAERGEPCRFALG